MDILNFDKVKLRLDLSKSQLKQDFIAKNQAIVKKALANMSAIESGEKVNVDENRQVGHYWLRTPELAPAEYQDGIRDCLQDIESFVKENSSFDSILVVGIGGSSLGPQFIAHALAYKSKRNIFFFDNTDPQGFNDVLSQIPSLKSTLVIVMSKSGSTPEPMNGMLVAQEAYRRGNLDFSKNFIAVTMPDSKLDQLAKEEGWLQTFPIWDWVGGRTSIWSAVGLLPFALLDLDINEMLRGASELDNQCRDEDPINNPALLLALFWLQETKAQAEKNMVVLPYSDRLELFSKYLQQLVMESLGKEKDLNGKTVNQGLTVFGNKGSSDQHSYIQQLREGPSDFFAIFVKNLSTNAEYDIEIQNGLKVSDYLNGFFLGTRKALYDNGRNSLTCIVPEINEYTIAMLIALFERAVSYYASFIEVNAYNQPGVEAGKKAAARFLEIQNEVAVMLENNVEEGDIIANFAKEIDESDLKIVLLHLSR